MKKIIDFCEKYNMLPKSGLVLCAVSGGKDSIFLLHVLAELRGELCFRLACAHFDHSLRGAESLRDKGFVEACCGEMGITCYTGQGDVAAFASENGLGIEEAARDLRYGFLEKTADEIGADRIATAHSADDNIETLLLNLARGSGLNGLCGIPPVRGRIVRPMLEISTVEIMGYLNKREIAFVEDSSNATDDYTRNRIRHNFVPALREISSGFDGNVMRCISLLREDEAFISGLADDFVRENYVEGSLLVDAFSSLPEPVAARVLRKIYGSGLGAGHVAAVLGIASGGALHASADVPGMRIRREYDRIIFGGGCESEKSLFETPLTVGQKLTLEEAGLEIISGYLPCCEEINNSDNTFFFQHDSICGRISVRARNEGDKIHLAGRNCTKTLKKLFSESNLNGAGKMLVPVICDDEGPIAVSGFGIAERCVPKAWDDVIYVRIENTT